MKKLIIIFLFAGTILAQNAGNTGLSFLKVGFGPRNIAMGDLGVVESNDLTSLYYNPALLADNKSAQIFVSHNEWVQDVRSELFGASFKLFGLPFAFGLNTTSINEIEIRQKPGEALSTFNAYYFFGSISTGFYVTEKLKAGATVRFINENLFSDEAHGWGFDLGLAYNQIFDELNLGIALRNLGSMNKLRNVETTLPTDLRVGLSYPLLVKSIKTDITLVSGYQKYLDVDNNHIHLGTELLYDKFLAIRAGYVTGFEAKSFSGGLGLIWNNIKFDYAFTPFEYNLGSAHTISVSYLFN